MSETARFCSAGEPQSPAPRQTLRQGRRTKQPVLLPDPDGGGAEDIIEYDIKVSLLGNRLIRGYLSIPFGLFGALLVFLAVVGKGLKDNYAFWFVFLFMVISLIVILLIMEGAYDLHIRLDSKGVCIQTREKQAGRITAVVILNGLLGLFSSNSSSYTSGYAAMSQLDTYVVWRHIKKAAFFPHGPYIRVKAGIFAEDKADIFCTRENYAAVAQFVRRHLPKNAKLRGEPL